MKYTAFLLASLALWCGLTFHDDTKATPHQLSGTTPDVPSGGSTPPSAVLLPPAAHYRPFTVNADTATFTQIPAHLQLYPRDTRNNAVVPITGTVNIPGVDSVFVEMYRDSLLWSRTAVPLAYSGATANFGIYSIMRAELVEYRFRVYMRDGQSTRLIAARDSITCGDVFIIGGQSNAHPTSTGMNYRDEFCRTLGVQTDSQNYKAYNPADTLWGYSNAIGQGGASYTGPYLVGAWGLRLQELIRNTYGIPTCIINGGAGGSFIEENLRDPNDPADLNTVYGRLLYRVRKARVADRVKAIFWYQGESNTVENYYANFTKLYQSWRDDYPSAQKLYLFQIRPGCGPEHMALRELQRTLPDSLPNIELMSTVGVPWHDGCHYFGLGYTMIGENIFRLVARDFYGSTDTANITPPDVSRAFFTSATKNEVAILIKNPRAGVSWPNDTTLAGAVRRMVDYFYIDSTAGLIQSGRVAGDTIKLRLAQPRPGARTVSYLPDKYYHGTPFIYAGPWLLNERGIGLLAFHNLPIYASGGTTPVESTVGEELPAAFSLAQNYPNPFNGTTIIRYTLPVDAHVTLTVYNTLGEEIARIADRIDHAGTLTATWEATTRDGGSLPSGIYFYRMRATPPQGTRGVFTATGKMLLVR